MRKCIYYALSLSVLHGILTGCAADDDNESGNIFEPVYSQAPLPSVRVESADCELFNIFETDNVECGLLHVPENRTKENGSQIQLAFAIIKADAERSGEDPIVYLNGGPGGESIKNIAYWQSVSIPFRQGRDFILLDQRGTGFSKPSLKCPFNLNIESMKRKDSTLTEIMRPCWKLLVDQGIDLTAYNNEQNAHDVEDLRKILGYKKINLYGISYGTQLALTIMRNHPEGIRSVVLDSVVVPQNKRFEEGALWMDQVFNTFFQGCERDHECDQAFPNLKTVFFDFVDQLNSAPVLVEIPFEEDIFPIFFNGDDVVYGFFRALYDETLIPILPMLIQAASENLDSLIPTLQGILPSFLRDNMSQGMTYSVRCHNDVPFNSYERSIIENAKFPRYENIFDFSEMLELCELWQAGVASSETKEPVESAIPTLIIAGEYDPITPPEFGKMVAKTLSNSFFYEFRGAAHGVTNSFPCAKRLVRSFLEEPFIAPNNKCVEDLPPISFVTY